MLHFNRLLRVFLLVFGMLFISSCSLMMAPVISVIANDMATKESKALRAKEPKTKVLLPKQIATVKRVAVMPFENLFEDDKVNNVRIFPKDYVLSGTFYPTSKNTGRIVSEIIEEKLLELRIVDVVERSRLSLILKEQNLMQSGVGGDVIPEIVAATAGAEAILLGSIVAGGLFIPDRFPIKFAGKIYLKARLVDTRNGKILLTVSDNQTYVSNLPTGLVVMVDHISKRIVDSIGAAFHDSRKNYPDAKPPTRIDFLKPISYK